jgi:hypothetical protein
MTSHEINTVHETHKLAGVRRYDILDTPADGEFDRITLRQLTNEDSRGKRVSVLEAVADADPTFIPRPFAPRWAMRGISIIGWLLTRHTLCRQIRR